MMFPAAFLVHVFFRQCAHQPVFTNCSDVCNAQRTMPKGPINWNTSFNYELDCQRVEFSLSQSNNVCFILFIPVTRGFTEDDDLGKLNPFLLQRNKVNALA